MKYNRDKQKENQELERQITVKKLPETTTTTINDNVASYGRGASTMFDFATVMQWNRLFVLSDQYCLYYYYIIAYYAAI